MVDVYVFKGKHRSILQTKSPKARLQFQLDYQDLQVNSEGDLFIIRSTEAAEDIKKDLTDAGLCVLEK